MIEFPLDNPLCSLWILWISEGTVIRAASEALGFPMQGQGWSQETQVMDVWMEKWRLPST